jgi:hypothetical protein
MAFMRPRAQFRIARWPATQSSEAAMVQAARQTCRDQE